MLIRVLKSLTYAMLIAAEYTLFYLQLKTLNQQTINILFISQPNKVISGTLTFNQPSLSDLNGDIYYDKKNVSLKPSGRQIDYRIGFAKDIGEYSKLITKFIIQDEYDHNKISDYVSGLTISGKY